MLKRVSGCARRGDTLIEVMFSVAVFALGAIGAISLMNRGLASAQNSLEITMARQEIDAQAETLRYIHDAYVLATLNESSATPTPGTYDFKTLWRDITDLTYTRAEINGEDPIFFTRIVDFGQGCDDAFRTVDSEGFDVPIKSFILNPRNLDEGNLDKVLTSYGVERHSIALTPTFPRLLYESPISEEDDNLSDAEIDSKKISYSSDNKTLSRAEGIWITAIQSEDGIKVDSSGSDEEKLLPDYYDFYIQTCWDAASGKTASSISTVVRLFNPDQVSLSWE